MSSLTNKTCSYASLIKLGLSFFSLCSLLAGCGHGDQISKTKAGQRFPSSSFFEYPWQITSPKGATILPDLYYAEDIQNEQAMPTTLLITPHHLQNRQGRSKQLIRYKIDRLIYPTIGNPALYTKEDEQDQLMVVLRTEKTILEKNFQMQKIDSNGLSNGLTNHHNEKYNTEVKLIPLKGEGIRFYLVDRTKRKLLEGDELLGNQNDNPSLFPLSPSQIIWRSQEGAPEEFQKRETLIVYFDQKAMTNIPEGFYDLRFEIDGEDKLREFQYNAVRVFQKLPKDGQYSVINVTDSQASTSKFMNFEKMTLGRLDQFKNYLLNVYKFAPGTPEYQKNLTLRTAAFITFNGDLHNGGGLASFLTEEVIKIYNEESRGIIEVLRDLPLPIFLTTGNHDGHVSMGQVPPRTTAVKLLRIKKALEKAHAALGTQEEGAKLFEKLKKTVETLRSVREGQHVDIFTGKYVLRSGTKDLNNWKRVDPENENTPLYDGFNQWRKSYGPLNYSWVYGDNFYLSLNSFDLRQHRRSGYGLYIVNYGGGISPFQMDWIRQDLKKANHLDKDVVFISHHDPRGGHNGEDHAYYFRQIPFAGMTASANNFIKGEIALPLFCKIIPEWAQNEMMLADCLHDGLQEWMRPDPEFDCKNDQLLTEGPTAGKCKDFFKLGENNFDLVHSGFQTIQELAENKRVRTYLIGHTHSNSLDLYYPGDELIPGRFALDKDQIKRLAALEVINPVRAKAYFSFMNRMRERRGEKFSSGSFKENTKRIWGKITSKFKRKKDNDTVGEKEGEQEGAQERGGENESTGGTGEAAVVASSAEGISEEEIENYESALDLENSEGAEPSEGSGDTEESKRWRRGRFKERFQKFLERYQEAYKDKEGKGQEMITRDIEGYYQYYLEKGGQEFQRTLNDHELAILRTTSIANLTSQETPEGQKSTGFTLLEVFKKADQRNYPLAQVNRITFFQKERGQFNLFKPLQTVELPRDSKEEGKKLKEKFKDFFKNSRS